MTKQITGKGRKRPQLDIPLERIELDGNNPRLSDECKNGSQLSIMEVLYESYDLEAIGYSMAENGYFDEEPIVVVPENLPASFKWDGKSIEQLEIELKELIQKNPNLKFIVVEGNRRVAAAKLLTDTELRRKLGTNLLDFPKPKNKEVENDLKIIPAIVYKDKTQISPYLGVKHILAVLKWESYAKALYVSKRIEEEQKTHKDVEKCVTIIREKIGDRSDVIKKQYMAYKIFEQAKKEDLDVNIKGIMDRFSLIGELLNKPSIREFIGVSSYKEINFNKKIVPQNKLENLERLLIWVFGNATEKTPLIADSRRIKELSPILSDKYAIEHLIRTGAVSEAFEMAGGEKEFLKSKLIDAKISISKALTVAFKYKKEKEMILLFNDLKKAWDALDDMFNKKD